MLARLLLILALLSTTSCATYSANQAVHDPWEGYNRKMYAFNDAVDRYALKPVAKGYKSITPDLLEVGISNFFSNIDDVVVTINDLLQGKFIQALQDSGRFLLNSTVGIGGLFDVASRVGLPKHHEDFGQTLGKWGVAEGPFVVLPFLGPATLRSTAGRVGDMPMDPMSYATPNNARYGLVGAELLNTRAQLLGASGILDSAFDPYLLLRDLYVKNRRNLTYDGELKPENGTDDLDELDAFDNEADELDELDELDALDDMDAEEEASDTPILDELDELDRWDAEDAAASN